MSKEQCFQTILVRTAITQRYLKQHGMIESMLAVEKIMQMSLEEYSKEIAFIRKVLLEGDFKTVVKCLQPFENRLDPKEFSAIMFCIHRQRLFELVEEPDEIELRELLEQDIVGLCTPEQYQQLFDFLTLEHVSEHPDFAEWTKLRGRNDCFQFLKPFIELIQSRIAAKPKQEPTLQELIASYHQLGPQMKDASIMFSKKFNSNESAYQKGLDKQNPFEKHVQRLVDSSEQLRQSSFQKPAASERSGLLNRSLAESQNVLLSQKFDLSEKLKVSQSRASKGETSSRVLGNLNPSVNPVKVSEREDQLSMSLTPSDVRPTSQAPVPAEKKDPILQIDMAKSIKLDASQMEASQVVEEDKPTRSIQVREGNADNKLSRSSRDPTFDQQLAIDSSKSAVVNIGYPYKQEEVEPEPVEFEYNLSRRNPFEKMRQSTKPVLIKLIASISDEKAMRVCQFSQSGKLFAVGTNSSRLKIYDVDGLLEKKQQLTKQLEPIYEIPNLHQKSVFSIDWSANEKFLVSCSNDSTVKLTKFDARLESHETNVVGRHEASIRMVRFDALLTRIVSCAEDHLIKVWDVAKNKSLQVLRGHYSSVNAIRLKENQTSNVLFSVSKDCSMRLWDLRTGEPEAISKPHESEMTYIARHGQNQIVSHKDGTVSMYTPSLQLIENIKIHTQEVRSVECCVQQAYYLSASFDGTTCIMQKDSHQRLKLTYERHNHVKEDDKVVFASFSQSNGYASCSVTGVCNLYSLS